MRVYLKLSMAYQTSIENLLNTEEWHFIKQNENLYSLVFERMLATRPIEDTQA